MRVFVTGGSGFVGRNLIPALKAKGFEVRALARSDASAKTVSALGAEPVLGDLFSDEALSSGTSGTKIVFHAAARVSGWGDPKEFERDNVLATDRVLQAAKKGGVERFVHVSTEAVLCGGGPIRAANENQPLPERPVGEYARTKGLAEKLVRAANGDGFATIIVRPRFVWGRGDTSILPRLVDAVNSGAFRWIGGGRYPTSTCHVANLCEALLLAAEKGEPGEAYFVSDGAPVEFRSFISALLETQGIRAGDKSVPLGVVRVIAPVAELIWRMFGLKSELPLTRMAVLMMGEEVTIDDAKARARLGYVGRMTRDRGLKELSAPAEGCP